MHLPRSPNIDAARGWTPPVRRRAGLAALVILLNGGWSPFARAGDLFIVCSPGLSVTMADIRDVFLGEKQFAGAVKLLPIDNTTAQTDFLEKALNMDAIKYTTAWTKKSFRDGITPPPVKGADGEVVEYLKHSPGGCGYVSTQPPAWLTLVGKL